MDNVLASVNMTPLSAGITWWMFENTTTYYTCLAR